MIVLHGWTPLEPRGLTITDPAAVIALRQGVALNQEQADDLRARVAAARAPLQRTADDWGVTVAVVARVRLAEMQARNQPFPSFPVSQVSAIVGARIAPAPAGREYGPS